MDKQQLRLREIGQFRVLETRKYLSKFGFHNLGSIERKVAIENVPRFFEISLIFEQIKGSGFGMKDIRSPTVFAFFPSKIGVRIKDSRFRIGESKLKIFFIFLF